MLQAHDWLDEPQPVVHVQIGFAGNALHFSSAQHVQPENGRLQFVPTLQAQGTETPGLAPHPVVQGQSVAPERGQYG